MKTNPSARRRLRIRVLLLCAALAAIIGFEFCVGESMAAPFGQVMARQADNPAAPDLSISDLVAAAR